MDKEDVNIDPVLEALGPLGVFSIVQCFLFFLSFVPDAFQSFSVIFTAQEVIHKCASPTNDSDIIMQKLHLNWSNIATVSYTDCNIVISRNFNNVTVNHSYPCLFGIEYDKAKDISIVSQFDLVCEQAALAGMPITVFAFGVGLGSFACPLMSDLFGRKRVIIISQAIMVIGSVTYALAPNYVILVIAKFILGFFHAGILLPAITAGLELFPTDYRGITSGVCSTLFWAVCIMSVAPTAFLLRFESWRVQELYFALAYVVIFPQLLLLSEPLRWLSANGKEAASIKVLEKAAKWNRKDVLPVKKVFHGLSRDDSMKNLEDVSGQTTTDDIITRENLSYKDMVTNRHLRTNLFVSCFIWFINGIVYSALYLTSSALAGSLYLNFFLNALAEGTSCILIFFLLKRFGRRNMVTIFHGIAGLGLMASSLCFSFEGSQNFKIAGTIFSLCGIVGVGGSFNSIFMYTPEIFPTNLRNRALGFSLASSTIGNMLAPYSRLLMRYAVWAPGTVFGVSNLFAALLLRLLPESKGRELPQTLQDLEAWYTTSA